MPKANHDVNTYSLSRGTRIIVVQMPVVDGRFDDVVVLGVDINYNTRLDHHDLVYCSVELFVAFILPTASVT